MRSAIDEHLLRRTLYIARPTLGAPDERTAAPAYRTLRPGWPSGPYSPAPSPWASSLIVVQPDRRFLRANGVTFLAEAAISSTSLTIKVEVEQNGCTSQLMDDYNDRVGD